MMFCFHSNNHHCCTYQQYARIGTLAKRPAGIKSGHGMTTFHHPKCRPDVTWIRISEFERQVLLLWMGRAGKARGTGRDKPACLLFRRDLSLLLDGGSEVTHGLHVVLERQHAIARQIREAPTHADHHPRCVRQKVPWAAVFGLCSARRFRRIDLLLRDEGVQGVALGNRTWGCVYDRPVYDPAGVGVESRQEELTKRRDRGTRAV